jgi:hypothetical protein
VRSCAPIAATVGGSGLNVSLDGRVSHQEDRLVSRGYFEALGVSPTWGRAFSLAEDADTPPPVVILNERFLRRQGMIQRPWWAATWIWGDGLTPSSVCSRRDTRDHRIPTSIDR